MGIDGISIIMLIIMITAIMVFFFMASNISIIRKKIENDESQHRIKYQVSLVLGEKAEAYRALLHLFYADWEKFERHTNRRDGYEQAKKLYTNEFVSIDKACPEYS